MGYPEASLTNRFVRLFVQAAVVVGVVHGWGMICMSLLLPAFSDGDYINKVPLMILSYLGGVTITLLLGFAALRSHT